MRFWFRRVSALVLAMLLTVGVRAEVHPIPEAEESALLPKVAAYAGQFADVDRADWFYANVAASYEYGLIRGRDASRFAPNESITPAELLTLSARVRAAYKGDAIPEANGAWYAPYVAYLTAEGAMDASLTDYNAPATRAQLAGIFALSLPDDAFDARNAALVTDAYASGEYITDVDEYTPCQPQILWLYRQGLLNGTDETGSFQPDKPVTRAETAVLLTRMVDPALRLTLDWAVTPAQPTGGRTLASLITAPAAVSTAPDYTDSAAIDALVRQMLAAGSNTITLRYPTALTHSDAQTLADVFTACVKQYCEQMYNAAYCTRYLFSGRATLTFFATNCLDDKGDIRAEEMRRLRDETMASAVEIHDTLWETGVLSRDMSQYEIAKTYYLWLCDHCVYDWDNANNNYSASHIAHSALLDGKAVCDGYTGAYNLLLKLEGIDCRALPSLSQNHIWTVATLDGTEYHIDVTWGDQSGRTDLRYFGMTAEEAYAAHPWENEKL